VHGIGRYNYRDSKYIDYRTKVVIWCNICNT